uniref:Uncharacterized protein n=1 Tax=Aegilops tauschii subsp. strangulata TaxID=200361 RepID=A0A453SMB5_AEGTS
MLTRPKDFVQSFPKTNGTAHATHGSDRTAACDVLLQRILTPAYGQVACVEPAATGRIPSPNKSATTARRRKIWSFASPSRRLVGAQQGCWSSG